LSDLLVERVLVGVFSVQRSHCEHTDVCEYIEKMLTNKVWSKFEGVAEDCKCYSKLAKAKFAASYIAAGPPSSIDPFRPDPLNFGGDPRASRGDPSTSGGDPRHVTRQ
jgi:hypothetical protein